MYAHFSTSSVAHLWILAQNKDFRHVTITPFVRPFLLTQISLKTGSQCMEPGTDLLQVLMVSGLWKDRWKPFAETIKLFPWDLR